MKPLWVASLLVCWLSCTGADRRDPDAIAKADRALVSGELEAARMHAEGAYRFTPDDPETRRVLAAVHRALGERAVAKGEYGRASDAYLRAAEREPLRRQRAADYLNAFETARDAGRELGPSAQLLARSVESEPNNMEVRLEAATAFDELGQPAVAVEHYLYLWEADRTKVPIGIRLGAMYLAIGAHDDAEAVFRRVMEQDPVNVQAQLQLADLHERAGNTVRARSLYQDLADQHPKNAAILFRFADFLERTNEDAEAERVRERAEAELPGVERRKMRTLKSRKKKR